MAGFVLANSCSKPSESSWQALYANARMESRSGYMEKALHLADTGYQQSEKRNQIWNWRFRILKAQIDLRQGNPDQAISLLAPPPPANSPPDVSVRRKTIQGQAFCQLGNKTDSEEALAQADNLAKGESASLSAEIALTRGWCVMFRDPGTALHYLEQAEKLARGNDDYIEGSAVINRGYILLKRAQYDLAIRDFERVPTITSSVLLRERALGNLVECYQALGDWRRSIPLAEQADELAAQINNNSDRERWLISLGRAHLAIREFSIAEPYFTQALALARDRKHQDTIWRSLNNLTQLALKRHDLETAERYWKEESTLKLGSEGKAYVTFDAATIAMERKDLPRAERLLVEILGLKTDDFLRLRTQRELGNVYWQGNKVAEADRTFRKAIEDAEVVMSKLPPEHRMSFHDVDGFYDSYVRFLVAQGKPDEALRMAERGRGQILDHAFGDSNSKQATFDLQGIQAVLGKRNQVALVYCLTDDESFLWVITSEQLKLLHLPSYKALRPLIDAYKSETVDHPRSINDSPGGQELYKTLVLPAERTISKRPHVVVVSSKILSEVNFEALIVPGNQPHYWIEDVDVEIASSLALLANHRSTRRMTATSRKQLFLLGAPIPASEKFPALPHAEEEMQRVQSHFPTSEEIILSGGKAIPQAYRASNPGEYRFIHIDAHSVASDVNPLDSFIALSPDGSHGYELKADEIKDTPLRADLVTLSACYSAGTRFYNGEGIVGLGWAFLRAGAHQVVASLWAVDDASTPQLMDDFYSELTKGKSAAESLRDAKLNMLHSKGNLSHPFYWASLQLYTGA